MKSIVRKKTLTLFLSGIFCLGASSLALADLEDGLIAHWDFDNCSAKDSSPNALDGILIGNPTCVDGVATKAMSFDGNDIIMRFYSSIPAANFTVAMWVNATDNNSGIFSVTSNTGHDRHIFLDNGKVCQRIWSGNEADTNRDGSVEYVSCTPNSLASGFNHIAYVVTNNKIQLFLNGKLATEIDGRPSEFDWADRFEVGFSADANNYYFRGVIDDFRYYKRALSDMEIQELSGMGNTVSGSINGLEKPSVTCKNLATGDKVSVPKVQSTWDCEAAGLTVAPGEKIQITIKGTSDH